MKRIRNADYGSLAELRYCIREFLRSSDSAAYDGGLEPQQYQALLAIRGLPHESEATIRRLADRLFLRHHSVVGLVDRVQAKGYVRRVRSKRDQRQVCVTLLPAGQKILDKVVRERLDELRTSGKTLIGAVTAIVENAQAGGPLRSNTAFRKVRASAAVRRG
jgi:DNA-binding MarR family transcriptional regulator